MGWAIGAGLALGLLLLVAFANFILIVARIVLDGSDAKFLVLTIALLGSGQTLLVFLAARAGLFSARAFETMWLISMCIVITSLLSVVIFGRVDRGDEPN